MKQLVIIEVQNCDDKQRSKAMKIVVGIPGVESVSLQGKTKNHIEVIGCGVDSVNMINLLRKKLKRVELVSVTPVDKYFSDDAIVTAPEAQNLTYYHRPSYQAVVPGYRSNYFDNPRYRPNYYGNYGYRPHDPACR